MTAPNLHPKLVGSLAAAAALICVPIYGETPIMDHGGSKSPIPFRASKVEVASLQTSAVTVRETEASSEAEDLEEQRDTLEREVDFFKQHLEAAKKRLDMASQAGGFSNEQSEQLEHELENLRAHLQEKKAELNQVESQLAPLTPSAGKDVIVPGEHLEIFVTEDPSFNGKYQVRRGGYLVLPSVGRITVAGKTLEQAEAAVRKALLSSQLQKATVMIEPIEGADVESGPTIFLAGEFKHLGRYKIPAGTAPTLVGVILSSGGVTDTADLSHVKVMRMVSNKSVVEEVNVQRIIDGNGLGSDITLSEGDVITVPVGQASLVYVTGNVKHQGSYKLKAGEKLTAYGAILQSGGFARFANERKVHVLRAMPDGTKVEIPVDVKEITRGHKPDVQLQVNDIVVIPEKFFSF
jgi:polysaccharide export outer membrane protein